MGMQHQSILRIAVILQLFVGSSVQAQIGTILWSDEFNTSSSILGSTSYWTARTGNNNGWGNGELQVYTSDSSNVAIEDDLLVITVVEHLSNDTTPPVRTFSSARLDTFEKVHVKYGTISAKIQVPNVVEGLWPAFWTLGSINATFPANGEMDIMEIGQGLALEEGLGNRRSISGAHWERNGAYTTNAGSRDFASNLNDTFFVYTLDWTPFNITTYVNDDVVWGMDISDANCVDCEEFHDFHYLLLNVAVGGGFTSGSGSSSSSSGCGSSSSGSSGTGCELRTAEDITAPLPASMLVDWVRIYDNGYAEILIEIDEGQVTTPETPPATAPITAPIPVSVVAPVSVPNPVPVPSVVAPVIPPAPVAEVVVPPAVAPVGVVAPVIAPSEDNIFFPRPNSGKGGKGSGKGGKGSGKGGGNSNANIGGDSNSKKSKKGKGDSSSSVESALNSAASISLQDHRATSYFIGAALIFAAII